MELFWYKICKMYEKMYDKGAVMHVIDLGWWLNDTLKDTLCLINVDLHTQTEYKNRQVFNIRRTLGNKNVDHSDVVGASPVGAAPTTYPIST